MALTGPLPSPAVSSSLPPTAILIAAVAFISSVCQRSLYAFAPSSSTMTLKLRSSKNRRRLPRVCAMSSASDASASS